MRTRSITSYISLILFLGANSVNCENIERMSNTAVVNCNKVISSPNVFIQTQPFTTESNDKLIWIGISLKKGSPAKCRLEANQSLNIVLKRLTRVHLVGVNSKGTRNLLEVTGLRDESDDHTVNFACVRQKYDQPFEYFNCTDTDKKNGVWINSVKLQLKNKIEAVELYLNSVDTQNDWIYLVDYGCQNLSGSEGGDLRNCKAPKTCRRPPSIENGRWRYLKDSSYKKVQYSCYSDAFNMRHRGRNGDDKHIGTAMCNIATNHWDGVPTCETSELDQFSSSSFAGASGAVFPFNVTSYFLGVLTGFILQAIVNNIARRVYSKWTKRNEEIGPHCANTSCTNREGKVLSSPFIDLPNTSVVNGYEPPMEMALYADVCQQENTPQMIDEDKVYENIDWF